MPRDEPPIRVGLIGHGLAGAFIHGPLIEAAGGYRIVAVATSKAGSLARRRDQPRVEREPEALIAASDVDLVVVASPNATHFSYAKAALEAGKSVVIDKPFVLSTREADDLIALADRSPGVLTVFHNRRLDGDFLFVKDRLEARTLGEVLLFEARWDRFRPEAPAAWRNSGEAGAGLLWDLAPHLIDQALQLFGPPDSLRADIAAQRPDALADDYFELTLRHGARRTILSASSVVAAARPRFSLHGTLGSLTIPLFDPYEAALRLGRHPADPGFFDGLPPHLATLTVAGAPLETPVAPGSWVAFYANLRGALRGDHGPAVTAQQAREVTALIEVAIVLSEPSADEQ